MAAGLLEGGMIGMKSGADGEAFIASCGLDVSVAEWSAVENFAVGHAVEGAAPSHGQVGERDATVQMIEQMKKDFLETILQGERQIHIALGNFRMRSAWTAEQPLHAVGEVPG